MKDFQGSFIHYLDEWSTETFPDVLVNYYFTPSDPSVGFLETFDITVIRDKKNIWELLTRAEQSEVEQYCKADMQQAIKESKEP